MTTAGDDDAGGARIEERRVMIPESNPGGPGLSERHASAR
jgi:hypothetical protein